MVLANGLLALWKVRIRVAFGVVVAAAAALAALSLVHSVVYASASTVMLVDSPQSALANADTDITGYLIRADVFARLMTSGEALQYIGSAAGIPGNLIAASGPLEVNGAPVADHSPVGIQGGRDVAVKPIYKLSFNQNPLLPTVEVNAEAPTTKQAIALANGAVTGFGAFLTHLETGNSVPTAKRIIVSELGGATGGIVDPGSSKKLAAIVFVGVFLLWCALVLFVKNLVTQLRVAMAGDAPAKAKAKPVKAKAVEKEPAANVDDAEDEPAESDDDELDREQTVFRDPVGVRNGRDLLDDLLGSDLNNHAGDREEEDAVRGEVELRP